MPGHSHYMKHALSLATLGRGQVEPNPMVGAVVVKNGKIIGEGYHQKFGGPHAEIHALRACKTPPQGATLYITLEPCNHFGKTPPCTRAIAKAGIAKVVYATHDPHTAARGGAKALRQAGISVISGILTMEARKLNDAFFKYHESGRPYVIAKWAMSLDGKIATRTGNSKYISSPPSLALAHKLRNEVDAVLVGIHTVLHDNPRLTVRGIKSARMPVRIVLDEKARLPADSYLVRTAQSIPTWIVTGDRTDTRILEKRGVHVIRSHFKDGRVKWKPLLATLGKRNIQRLLVEGGSRVLGSAFDEKIVDEAAVWVAPIIIGGEEAVTPVSGRGIRTLAQAFTLHPASTQNSGPDVLIRGKIRYLRRRTS